MNLTTNRPLPLPAVRALALETQRLTAPLGAQPPADQDALYATVEQLGCVQIDTLQMVHRSQYIALWSRHGRYDRADFDRLIYDPADRRLFEYWQHAASIIPLKHFRYSLPVMARSRSGRGWVEWAAQPESQQHLEHARARIRADGSLRVSDFQYDGPKRGPWWDWKPIKAALEYLYDTGEMMIADRQNFQRVYDLRERVLPEGIDTTEPTYEEMMCFRLEQAGRAAGIATARQLVNYAFFKSGESAPALGSLVEQGALIEVEAETASGDTKVMLIHRDNLPLLERALDGALPTERTTFLSPFDSLWWTTGRDEMVFGFRQRLEAYVPAPKRIWGYFCLPILHRDRPVGRFDVKLDRKSGTLILRALYLEPDVAPDERLVADVAAAMRDFLAFHDATDLAIERSDPAEFGERLLAAL